MSSWEIGFYLRVIASLGVFGAGIACAHWLWDKVGLKSLLTYYGVRVMGMLGLVVFVKQVPPDVSGWYLHGQWMIGGHFPGVDFLSPYHAGFNALLALGAFLFKNPIGIVLLFTGAELLAVVLLYKCLEDLFSREVSKKSIILYLTSPIVFFQSFLGAQDETLLLLGIALVLYAVVRTAKFGMFFLSLIFSVVFTKVLAVFYLFPFAAIKRYKGLASLIVIIGIYLLAVYAFGIKPIELNFGRELGLNAQCDKIGEMVTIGNVWYLLPKVPGIVPAGLMAVCLGLLSLPIVKNFFMMDSSERTLIADAIYLSVVWVLVFSLLYKMTFSAYLIPIVPLVCLLMVKDLTLCCIGTAWHIVNAIKDPLSYGYKSMSLLPGNLVNASVAMLSVLLTVVMIVCVYRACIVKRVLEKC